MNSDEIILAIAENPDAIKALPKDIRVAIRNFNNLHAKRIQEEKERREKLEKERAKRLAKEKAEEEKEMNKLLCKNDWGCRVPVERRFCLCEKESGNRQRYEDFCVIDIVRRFKSPYWGYYCRTYEFEVLKAWYRERLLPVLSAKTDEARYRAIRNDFDFFEIRPEEKEWKFRILKYEVDNDGNVKIIEKSDAKTWAEHRNDLRLEFEE